MLYKWLQHLSGLDANSVRLEMMRVVVNALDLQAGYETAVPKWRLLAWLLPTAGLTPAESQLCKLALFWEWFAYSPHAVTVNCIGNT